MNASVLEGELVAEAPVFARLLMFVVEKLPELENTGTNISFPNNFTLSSTHVGIDVSSGEELVLYGNFSVLGLLLLRHLHSAPLLRRGLRATGFKFAQAVIRFDENNIGERRCSSNFAFFLKKGFCGTRTTLTTAPPCPSPPPTSSSGRTWRSSGTSGCRSSARSSGR